MFIALKGYMCREKNKICVHFLHWDTLLDQRNLREWYKSQNKGEMPSLP